MRNDKMKDGNGSPDSNLVVRRWCRMSTIWVTCLCCPVTVEWALDKRIIHPTLPTGDRFTLLGMRWECSLAVQKPWQLKQIQGLNKCICWAAILGVIFWQGWSAMFLLWRGSFKLLLGLCRSFSRGSCLGEMSTPSSVVHCNLRSVSSLLQVFYRSCTLAPGACKPKMVCKLTPYLCSWKL